MIDLQTLAAEPLPEHEQRAERCDTAADNFILAVMRVNSALAKVDDELAEQHALAFRRAFGR